MRAISGRDTGPRYATIASVSSAACESPRSTGRSNSRAHASAASRDAPNAQPPATCCSTIPLRPSLYRSPSSPQRRLDPLDVVVRPRRQLLEGQRLRGDDEQRLDRSGERVDRVRGDQAERAIHSSTFLSVRRTSARDIRIGANGAACAMRDLARPCAARAAPGTRRPARRARAPAPRRRSRSGAAAAARRGSARRTATRAGSATPDARATRAAARRRATASHSPSGSGSCGASLRSGPRRQRCRSEPEEAVALLVQPLASHTEASFMRRYSASRRASSSAASSGSSSASSASSSGNSRARLQLEQRGDQHEELAAGVEIELAALGEALARTRRRSPPCRSRPGGSPPCSTSVRSRSNGPSNASRSSSSSRTVTGHGQTLAPGCRTRPLGWPSSAPPAAALRFLRLRPRRCERNCHQTKRRERRRRRSRPRC